MESFKKWILHESSKPKSFMGKKIVYVDTKKFRSSSLENEEFCTSGIHEDFPKSIAEDEIFIDDSLKSEEIPTVLKGIGARIRDRQNGSSPEKSYENGLRHERKIRRKKLHAARRISRYATLRDSKGKIEVFVVSGEGVRDHYKTDFSQGGHGYVYDWIPKGEIWLEEEESDEFPAILAHEYAEMVMMRDLGMDYEKAHGIASKIEKCLRDKKFGKGDIGNLTKYAYLLTSPSKEV